MLHDVERWIWVWYTPFGLGGVETYLLNMARVERSQGLEVCVAGVNSLDGPLRDSYAALDVRVLDWSGFDPAYMRKGPAESICHQLIHDLATLQPTLLAINDCTDFVHGAIPLLRRLRPYCTILDTFHIDAPDDGYLRRRRPYLDWYDGVAGTNQNILARFKKMYPRSRTSLRYIPNGVAVPSRERRPPSDELRLLYVGRLAQEQKRVLELPNILNRLRAAGRRFTMTIAGDGPQRGELASALERLGLADVVRLVGFVPPSEVVDYFFTHDVVVNVSSYEGFSMTILEALAAGCVPACTELPSLDRDVFRDGVSCRLCPVAEPERMADILASLSRDELPRLSEGARVVGRRFTAERMADDYAEFVRELRLRRSLQPWPNDPRQVLAGNWDMTRNNPWLPHPHPLKKWARRFWGRLTGRNA